MTRTRVLDLAALPPGGVELLVVHGMDVALFRRGDEFFAIGNECAHKGGNLCDGRRATSSRVRYTAGSSTCARASV